LPLIVLPSSDAWTPGDIAERMAAVAPSSGKASDQLSNFGHAKHPLLGAWNASARFLSMFQPLATILFWTWLWAYTAAMPRKLVWTEKQNFQGFGCSECNWVFKPSGAPLHESLDEMKQKYEDQRDKEFAAHVCAKHSRATRPRTE